MWFKNLFKSLTSTSSRRRRLSARLCVETLEDRCVLSFSMPVEYGAGLSPQVIGAADFDGNGRLDLAGLDSANNSVSVLLGNGDGTFQPPQTSGTDWGPTAFVAGDLNGDGQADLVTNHLSVLLSNGDGTFAPPQSIALPPQASQPEYPERLWEQGSVSVAVGDFNADGTLDLLAGGQTSYPIYFDPEWPEWRTDSYANVLLGNGDGTFAPALVKHVDVFYSILRPGDFNNDGRLDVVLNGGSMLGNGDGTLQDFVPSTVSVVGVSQPVGDFNGDGKLDVLSSHETNGPILWLGKGDGTFEEGDWIDLRGEAGWRSTVLGDVNADGKLDVVVLRHEVAYGSCDYLCYDPVTTRTARVLLGHGNGSFVEPIIMHLGTVEGSIYFTSPVLADFDGDGFPDLTATKAEYYLVDEYEAVKYQGVHVMLNDGVWTFPAPTISIGDVTVTEGNSGTRAAAFTVTLSGAFDQTVTVNFNAASGTATAGGDFQSASSTRTFAPGETSKTITIMVNGDRLPEANEAFAVNLSNPINATIADGQGVGTIVDDEPRITISDVSKKEGKKGQTTLFTFTVTLSAAYDRVVTMSFRTINGTANTADGDYVAKSGTLTFAPGETIKYITIEVKGDSKREGNETFYLDLFGLSSNALFTKNRGIGTILNDD